MRAFTGTGALVRLALRRDRIKLPVWIIAIAGGLAINVPAVVDFYGSSLKEQMIYATTTAPSVVSRIFGGPINGPNIGEIVQNETFLFIAILIAFMSTLAVVRHTRQNEETGREEIIGSAIVGRHASLTAALIVVFGTNILIAVLTSLAFLVNGLPIAGSIATGAALGGIGMVFAAFAAIASQISESAHGANSLAGLSIAAAFLLRAIGDGVGKMTDNGMAIISAWPSWLSPIGWGQQLHGFTEERWWTLGLLAGCAVLAASVAFLLNARRDVGLGMIPPRRGPARAARSLLSPTGLAWRLQRSTLRGWTIGMLIGGFTVGAVANEFKSLFTENDQVEKIMRALGGNSSNFTDILFSGMFSLTAIAFAAYAIQSLLRMRSEEAGGQLEPVLATNVSRQRWMASHIALVVTGVVLLTIVFGATTGLTYVLTAHAPWSEVVRLTAAAMVHIPAVLTLAALVPALFGLLPRAVLVISWTALTFCLVIAQFGRVLELPQWVLSISPFSHTPTVPVAPLTWTPLVLLSGTAVLLLIVGIATFRNRDLTTS